MSTKIYNGAVLPKMEMTELLVFCRGLQSKMKMAQEIGMSKHWADVATRNIDRESMATGKAKTKVQELKQKSWLNILEGIREAESKHYRHPSSDFESSAVFFPLPDKIMAIFFGDNQSMIEIWEQHSIDYHYQDSSERPDEVEEKAWKARSEDWNKVLTGDGKDGVPSHNGFTFQFTANDIYFAPKWEDVIKYIPTMKKRVEEQLLDMAIAHVNKDEPEVAVNRIMSIISEAQTYIKNKKNKKQIDKWKKSIQHKLIKRF